MTPFAILRAIHIGFGVVALVTMFIPLFAKKGSRVHVRAGRIYVCAMGLLAATGVPLALRGAFDPNPAHRASSFFLFFIALLAANNAWLGVRVLRTKRRTEPSRALVDLAPPLVLIAGAIGIFALGVSRGVVLHVFFGMLGTSLGVGQLKAWLKQPTGPRDAILRHIGAMGVSCIVTMTAFTVTNARHLGAAVYNPIVWIAPAVVGAGAIFLAQRRWRARLAPRGNDGFPRAEGETGV